MENKINSLQLDKYKQIKSGKIPVVVIFAPTASGKTALTKELFCEQGSHFIFKSEIISADSQAVYKGMNIGTAKPDREFCKIIPHHLIDVVEPSEQFTVADFVEKADIECEKLFNRGLIPVLCGGTGFYIRNFLYGLPKTPESSIQIRNLVQEKLKNEGKEALYAELQKIDPKSAEKIHLNDEYRICRALEVYYATGKSRSSFELENQLRDKYDFIFVVLEPPRDVLRERIYERVEVMFNQGLEAEVKGLIAKGFDKNTPGMKAIGYSEFFQYEDLEQIKERIQHNSYKYAKKQFTYIRDIPGSTVIPFSASDADVGFVADLIQKKLFASIDLY